MLFETADKRVVVAHGTKCGSRTALMWCLLTRQPDLYDTHRHLFYPDTVGVIPYPDLRARLPIAEIKGNANFFHLRTLPKCDHPIRVCITRDPVERFISAYRNRVMSLKVVKSPGIQHFIDNFDKFMKNGDIRTHFSPMWHFYGVRPDWFTHIFDISQMAELKELMGPQLPDFHLHRTDEQGVEKPTLTGEQRLWVMKRYAVDYALWRPQASSTHGKAVSQGLGSP